MSDPTEGIRRLMVAEINNDSTNRESLEARHGQVWDTTQLQEDFWPLSFSAPMIVVRRKSDGGKGTLMFQHDPRYYFSFSSDD